jgi:hypothetical protein
MPRVGLGLIASRVRIASYQIILRRLLGPLALTLNPNITDARILYAIKFQPDRPWLSRMISTRCGCGMDASAPLGT